LTARALAALARGAARRPLLVVVVATLLGMAGAGLAVGLRPTASAETFVGKDSASYQATEAYDRHFGQEPIEVLVQGNLRKLLLGKGELERLAGLEGCIAGKVPKSAWGREGGADGPCASIARLGTVRFVIGPGTFVAAAAEEIDAGLQATVHSAERLADAAGKAVREEAVRKGKSEAEAKRLARVTKSAYVTGAVAEVATLAGEYDLKGVPSLEEHSFVSKVVFDPPPDQSTPKARFAYLFPSPDAALISIRLKSGVSASEAEATIAQMKRATAMPQWRLRSGRYLLTGEPAIIAELSSSITRSIVLLLIAVALLMALALSLVFRGRRRLLPLVLALLSTALTFGGLAASGAGLSIGEVAVLPVLIGLAVDYAIQLQSRMGEVLQRGECSVRDAASAAARAGGPSIAAAAAASGGAMLVLELSPVPTVRDFATLLVIGLAVALLCVVTVGSAATVLLGERGVSGREGSGDAGRGVGGGRGAVADADGGAGADGGADGGASADGGAHLRPGGAVTRLILPLSDAWSQAGAIVQDNPLTRLVTRVALGSAQRARGRALALGVLLAAIGFALFGQVPVQTDITKLVPQGMSSLRNLSTLERVSGVGGEIDLMVSGADVTKPKTIEWMSKYESAVLRRFGYSSSAGCGEASLCPAFSLPALIEGFEASAGKEGSAASSSSRTGAATTGSAEKLSAAEVLEAIPAYFSQDVITANRRFASLAFGIRLMSLDKQERIIESMRSSLHPPQGVHAQLVGLPVLAAQASAAVGSTSRRVIEMLVGLAIVALVLLLAFRGDLRRALVPIFPVALACGWSALLVYVLGIPLNPMSVTLSALTIAISTEFSVLLSERFHAERRAGLAAEQALARAWSGTGAAIAASGVTAIAGFGVLALSDIAMLRDFGLVTLIDLTVSLLGVLLLLPATILIADDGGLWRSAATAVRSLLSAPRRAAGGSRGSRRNRARHGTTT
jgi:hypothetical protein